MVVSAGVKLVKFVGFPSEGWMSQHDATLEFTFATQRCCGCVVSQSHTEVELSVKKNENCPLQRCLRFLVVLFDVFNGFVLPLCGSLLLLSA